jgi:hypothetical protein
MSERGVFAVDRGIWDHPMFADEPFTEREAWSWLIGEASFKARMRNIGGKVIPLERGQLAASVRFMAERWKWSKSRVDRFVHRLKTETMIGTDSGTGILVITVCNYDRYQRVSLPDRDSERDTNRDTDGTAAGQQRDKREYTEYTEYTETPSLRSGVAPPVSKPKRARAKVALPDDWTLDERDIGYAADRGFDVPAIDRMSVAFANHHRSHGNVMADWHAAWRTWTENEIKFNRGRNGNGTHGIRTNPGAGPAPTRDATFIAAMGRTLERRRAARAADDPGRQELREAGGAGAAEPDDAEPGAEAGDDRPSGQLAFLPVGRSRA